MNSRAAIAVLVVVGIAAAIYVRSTVVHNRQLQEQLQAIQQKAQSMESAKDELSKQVKDLSQQDAQLKYEQSQKTEQDRLKAQRVAADLASEQAHLRDLLSQKQNLQSQSHQSEINDANEKILQDNHAAQDQNDKLKQLKSQNQEIQGNDKYNLAAQKEIYNARRSQLQDTIRQNRAAVADTNAQLKFARKQKFDPNRNSNVQNLQTQLAQQQNALSGSQADLVTLETAEMQTEQSMRATIQNDNQSMKASEQQTQVQAKMTKSELDAFANRKAQAEKLDADNRSKQTLLDEQIKTSQTKIEDLKNQLAILPAPDNSGAQTGTAPAPASN